MEYKYGHVFMVLTRRCETCNDVTNHFFAVVSNSKKMNNSKRIKQCENCGTQTDAPIGEDD